MFDVSKIPKEFPRNFVPNGLDFSHKEAVLDLARVLSGRDISETKWLVVWVHDIAEFKACLGEAESVAAIRSSCDVSDEKAAAVREYFEQELASLLAPIQNEWDVKYHNSPARIGLDRSFWAIYDEGIENRIRLFRKENIPIEEQDAALTQGVEEVVGSMMVSWEGEEKTIEEIEVLLEEVNRDLRERAYRAVRTRYAQDADHLEDVFDKMLAIRHKTALNAGYENYLEYFFASSLRCYTIGDCERFHEMVERVVVPALNPLYDKRRAGLGVDVLYPWDMAVDPTGKEPLRPFADSKELLDGVQRIFARMHPQLLEYLEVMRRHELFDLDAREGKSSAIYMISLDERRLPFVFTNVVGGNNDIRLLIHELGHCFQMFASRNMPERFYWEPPLDFDEVTSMTMELLAADYLDEFYSNEADQCRARREFLDEAAGVLPWIACVDEFQHRIYTHPGHAREERSQIWIDLLGKYFPQINDPLAGDFALGSGWHETMHIFVSPFYSIEYAIAQIGALQIWQNSRRNEKEAIDKYLYAASLGGTRSLPELFRAAGANFALDEATVGPLIAAVIQELL